MAKPYQHLTVGNRIIIEHERDKGTSCKQIAKMLGKHPTTVSREVRCKTAQLWQEFAQTLRLHPRKLSPELYHGRKTPIDGQESLSGSWLYELLHRDRHQGGDLYTGLPRRGRKYRKRLPSDASSSKIPHRIDIDQRPKEVDARNVPGHWEIDTIIGHGHQGVLLTAIERYSRGTRIRVLPHRQAQFIAFAILEMLLPVQHWVRTITVDNGLEFAAHTYAANVLNAQFYFCKPYHSWQRGQIEQLNGLVRRTFPKKQSFHHLTQEEIAVEEQQLNHMPRKCLGFRTPQEGFDAIRAQAPPKR
ncbi:MAG: IS30 family transposase [Gammaproteobacteria bacterium]|nr:IS30 family transposase [Gammaproteobacteria bacterium]